MIRFRWRGKPVTIIPDFWGIGMLCVLVGGMRSGKADWADWVFYVGFGLMIGSVARRLLTGELQRSWRERLTGKK